MLYYTLEKPDNRAANTGTAMVQRLKRLLGKLLAIVVDKPLPPASPHELALLEELREAFSLTAPLNTADVPASQAIWLNNLNRLRELVIEDDPREFLRWDVVQDSMFVTTAPYVTKELVALKRNPLWNSRWRKALQESPAGHPVPYPFFPKTSGNLIHHAYHLAQFEEKTGLAVNDMDSVLEFG